MGGSCILAEQDMADLATLYMATGPIMQHGPFPLKAALTCRSDKGTCQIQQTLLCIHGLTTTGGPHAQVCAADAPGWQLVALAVLAGDPGLLPAPVRHSAALRGAQLACGATLRHEAHCPAHHCHCTGRKLPGHTHNGEVAHLIISGQLEACLLTQTFSLLGCCCLPYGQPYGLQNGLSMLRLRKPVVAHCYDNTDLR